MSAERSVHHFAPGRSDVRGIEVLLAGHGDGREAETLRQLLGGKGAGLHALAARGFDVPCGFTLSTDWCAAYHQGGRVLPGGLREAIGRAVEALEANTGRKLGAPSDPLLVAVRSGAAQSMPGMMETVLNVDALEGIVEAVERVFVSFESERAIAYRKRKGLAGLRGTAVVVQEMCPAEAAGVAFTADPASGEPVITVEAVRGLGDGLVSGEVTPDRYRLRRGDLEVLEEAAPGPAPVLAPPRLREVASLALRVEEAFGHAVDVEWAMACGKTRLLQARAVAGAGTAAAVRARLRAEAARLRALGGKREARGKRAEELFLVRHNLDQTLSYPKPMTRDLLGELLGRGGALQGLYLDLGFRPSREVLEEGFLVIVCGRIFADVRKAAELFYGSGVLRHDRDALRSRPELLDEPPAAWDRRSAGPLAVLRTLWSVARVQRRLGRLRQAFPPRFAQEVLPPYLAWCRAKRDLDLSALDPPALLEELEDRAAVAYRRFPREALKLSFLAAAAHAELRDLLERGLGREDGGEATRTLLSLLDGDHGLEQSRMLAALGRGEITIETFLESHGHRSGGEMELAQPRWREDPGAVWSMARSLGPGAGPALEARIEARRLAVEAEEERVRLWFRSAGGTAAVADLKARLERARALLPWRESWKHHWMRGVDLVRRVLLELDRRLGLSGDVFYLTRAELREIVGGGGPVGPRHLELIRARREEERLDRSIPLGDCLTVEDLEGLAGPAHPGTAGEGGSSGVSRGGDLRKADGAPGESAETPGAPLRGAPLSPGQGEGRAWIATCPGEDCPVPAPFVLVCPSTDPGWTPILAQARAVVVERGGVLSHGAIVCRDFAVPAVVLPGATGRLVAGELLRVDGSVGTVTRPADGAAGTAAAASEQVPPEPYVPPARPGLGRRAAGGLAVAIALSIAIVLVPALSSALRPGLRAALDWTIDLGWPAWRCIGFAAAAACALAAAIQLAAGDRALLRRMRARMDWYRRQLRSARKAGAGAMAAALEGRRRQAAIERALELLRPVGWSFLPFCLAYLWVADRFSVEPIRPGTTFTVSAVFRPAAGNRYLRRAGLTAGGRGGLRILDAPTRKLEPNGETPALGPYRARWSVQAPDREGPVPLAITTRDERLEGSVLISRRREFAPAGAVRFRSPGAPPEPEIVAIEVEHPPLRVELPGPAFELLSSILKPLTGGRGVTPRQAALGPVTTFLLCAVLLALLLQRATGMR